MGNSLTTVPSQEELLREAATKGDIETVKNIIGTCKIDAQDIYGCSALVWASMYGHIEVVDFLLSEGADVNLRDNGGKSSLIWASGYGRESVVKLLIENDADIDLRDVDGKTALDLASYNEAIKTLLRCAGAQEGQDVEQIGGWKCTNACKSLLKSSTFRVPGYQKNCTLNYPKEGHPQGAVTHVDHIIELHQVSVCFSRAFKGCTLEVCLKVLCPLNKILNGPHNLCRISEQLNRTKHIYRRDMIAYVTEVKGNMQDVCQEINAMTVPDAAAEAKHNFVTELKENLEVLYGIKLA